MKVNYFKIGLFLFAAAIVTALILERFGVVGDFIAGIVVISSVVGITVCGISQSIQKQRNLDSKREAHAHLRPHTDGR